MSFQVSVSKRELRSIPFTHLNHKLWVCFIRAFVETANHKIFIPSKHITIGIIKFRMRWSEEKGTMMLLLLLPLFLWKDELIHIQACACAHQLFIKLFNFCLTESCKCIYLSVLFIIHNFSAAYWAVKVVLWLALLRKNKGLNGRKRMLHRNHYA